MGESLRITILTKLSNNFTTDQLKIIDNVITSELCRYDVTEKSTNIVPYQGGLPNEVKSFLVCKKIKGLTKSSLKHYQQVLTHFCLNINNNIKQLNANDIRLYLLSYEQTHDIGKSVLDDKRRVLNSFFTWMLREEIINVNPMLKIDVIKCDKTIREPLMDIELEQMRNASVTLREKALLEILYSTGARVSEIIALNRNDLDYTTGKVKVFGKGKKERYCFLNARAQLAIKKYLFSRLDNEDALFVTNKKPYARLGKGTIEKEIKKIGIKAEINRSVFPHLLRHTFATHMLAHDASIAEVQVLLGHESPQTTMIYAKMDLHRLQAVHQRCII